MGKVECWAVVPEKHCGRPRLRHEECDAQNDADVAHANGQAACVVHLVEQPPWLAQLVAAWRAVPAHHRDECYQAIEERLGTLAGDSAAALDAALARVAELERELAELRRERSDEHPQPNT